MVRELRPALLVFLSLTLITGVLYPGVVTLFGALSIAEISGMFRDPGGQYVYFNKGFNHFVGYLYGWAAFVVIQGGSIASIAYVFADSLGYFVALPAAVHFLTNFDQSQYQIQLRARDYYGFVIRRLAEKAAALTQLGLMPGA